MGHPELWGGQRVGHPPTSGTQIGWTYDRYGNRQQQSITAGAGGYQATTSADPATNRMTGTGVQYDAAGNMMTDGVNSYQYDDQGAMRVAPNGYYSYDAFGRVNELLDGDGYFTQGFVYGIQNRRLAVFNPQVQTTKYQIYVGNQPIAFANGSQLTYQYQNQVGTEGARLKNGQLTTFSSMPFGDGQAAGGAAVDQDTYHYAGLDSMSVSPATAHATFRDYHLTAGRWLSPDPYDGSYGTDPQSLNRYTYSLSNPLGLHDPMGLDTYCTWTTWDITDPDTHETSSTYRNDMVCIDTGQDGGGNVQGGGAPSNPGVRSCVGANFAQRAAVRLLSPLAAKTGATVGYGVGGSIGAGGIGPFGFNFAASQQLLVSPDGTAGLATTYTKQLFSVASKGFGGIVGFQAAFSNAKTFTDNAGLSIDAGIMAADEVGAALDVTNSGATVTVGAGFGGRGHAGTFTYTVVTPFCGIGGEARCLRL